MEGVPAGIAPRRQPTWQLDAAALRGLANPLIADGALALQQALGVLHLLRQASLDGEAKTGLLGGDTRSLSSNRRKDVQQAVVALVHLSTDHALGVRGDGLVEHAAVDRGTTCELRSRANLRRCRVSL